MSDFFDTPSYPVACKQHRCVFCYFPIATGEQYTQQTGFFEGHAFRNRFHKECWKALSDDGDFEFSPGSGDPPDRLQPAPQS